MLICHHKKLRQRKEGIKNFEPKKKQKKKTRAYSTAATPMEAVRRP